jgi:hypothetical protein
LPAGPLLPDDRHADQLNVFFSEEGDQPLSLPAGLPTCWSG